MKTISKKQKIGEFILSNNSGTIGKIILTENCLQVFSNTNPSEKRIRLFTLFFDGYKFDIDRQVQVNDITTTNTIEECNPDHAPYLASIELISKHLGELELK